MTSSFQELLHDNERTLIAWLRTATALFALGCALAQLGGYLEQHDRASGGQAATFSSGIGILILALMTVVLGVNDYHRRRVAIETARTRAKSIGVQHSRALYPLAILVGITGLSLFALMALVA